MTSTAVTTQDTAKRATVKKEAAEAALVEHFSDTVKLEINNNGQLYLDKTKMKAVKKFQKTRLKNSLSVAMPFTVIGGGIASLEYLFPGSELWQSPVGWISIIGLVLITAVPFCIVEDLGEKRIERRNQFLAKNSEPVIESFLFARGIIVDQETLTAVTKNIVGIFTDKEHNPTARTYTTTDGHDFRLRVDSGGIKIEFIETATLEVKQTVVEISTQLPSNMAVVDEIRNKTLQLSTQQLTVEKAYTFRKAQEDAKKALQLAQELRKLGDNNWEQELNASLQPINVELEAIIEECRNEKRQQLASMRN